MAGDAEDALPISTLGDLAGLCAPTSDAAACQVADNHRQ
jgi:hypothetical protein